MKTKLTPQDKAILINQYNRAFEKFYNIPLTPGQEKLARLANLTPHEFKCTLFRMRTQNWHEYR